MPSERRPREGATTTVTEVDMSRSKWAIQQHDAQLARGELSR